jgi:ribosome-binding factor A
MNNPRVSDIKRAQKESLLLHEVSGYFLRITLDDERLKTLTLNRVKLSRDKSSCTLFFYCSGGAEMFKKLLPTLILYKPSMRKALADQIDGRYTPQLIFKYDAPFERQLGIEALLDKIKEEEEK